MEMEYQRCCQLMMRVWYITEAVGIVKEISVLVAI